MVANTLVFMCIGYVGNYAEKGHGVEVAAEFRIYPSLGLTNYLHGVLHRVRGILMIFALASLNQLGQPSWKERPYYSGTIEELVYQLSTVVIFKDPSKFVQCLMRNGL